LRGILGAVLVRFFLYAGNKITAALAQETAYGTYFLWLPVFVGSGAVGYFHLEFEPSLNKLLALTLLLALFAGLTRPLRIVTLILMAVLAASLGAVLAKLETLRLDTHFIMQEMIVPITARIVSWEEQEQGGHRLIVRVISTQWDTDRFQGNADRLQAKKIRISARSLPDGVTIGSGLSGLVSLRPPSGPVRAGAYDFGFHAFYRGLSAQGFFMGQPQLEDLPPPDNLLEQFDLSLDRLRIKMNQRIAQAIEGEAGSIASALITGQRGGISDETNQALRISGLAHILSISGLHMAMVTGMVLLVARSVLGGFSHFSSRHPPRKIAAFVALVFSGFYLLLSGADIAAQRAFIMVAIMLLAVLFDRAALTMRNISLAALIILILTPHAILSPSFQMSFAATAALIAVFGGWARRQMRKNRVPKGGIIWRFLILPPLSTLIASLVAGSASGLYGAYHFANIAPLGLVSNVAALPIISLIVMPPALLACILMPLGLESLPLTIMGMGIEWVKIISFFVADLTPDISPAMMPPPALIFLTLALILLVFMHSHLRWLAFAPMITGLLIYIYSPLPMVMIAQAGNLVGVVTATGKVALSRPRPNAFILSNWLPVFNARTPDLIMAGEKEETGFSCNDLTCHVTMADGNIFAMAEGKTGAETACRLGDMVFLNYLGGEDEYCSDGTPAISLRDLARSGAAMIYPQTSTLYQIKWAYGESLRPWNRHRHSAKNALGLP